MKRIICFVLIFTIFSQSISVFAVEYNYGDNWFPSRHSVAVGSILPTTSVKGTSKNFKFMTSLDIGKGWVNNQDSTGFAVVPSSIIGTIVALFFMTGVFAAVASFSLGVSMAVWNTANQKIGFNLVKHNPKTSILKPLGKFNRKGRLSTLKTVPRIKGGFNFRGISFKGLKIGR